MEQIINSTFNTDTLEGQVKVVNAMNGSGVSMKNLEDGVIVESEAILQYAEITDHYGKEQEVIVTVVYGKDGTTYAGISDTVAKSATNIIEMVKTFNLDSFNVKFVKAQSSKGNEFINLQLAL